MVRSVLAWLLVGIQFGGLAWLAAAVWLSRHLPWSAAVLLLLALALLAIAAPAMGASLTPNPLPNGRGLRTGGIYRFIRHPMYLALVLAAIGGAIASPAGWIPAALLVAVALAKVAIEERELNAIYADFAEYRRRTKRFIPFVW